MTPLEKPVKRKGTVPVHSIGNKRLIVQLEPGDQLAMREENKRSWFKASFSEIFVVMVQIHNRKVNNFIVNRTKELLKNGECFHKKSAQARARKEAKEKFQ
jgi:hypothetical protein